LWLLFWFVLVGRFDRVVASVGGPLDEWLALGTLLIGLLGSWVWSVRGTRRRGISKSPHDGWWGAVGASLARNKLAAAGLVAVIAFYLLALLTPFLAPFDPASQGDLIRERLLAPSRLHPLGTDQFARDVLSRLLYGARVSLTIGFVAVGISVTIGTVLGATSGYLGGRIDGSIMRFVDLVISFPRLVLLITVIAFFEPSIFLIVVVLGLTQWPQTTRIVRGEVLSLREREFIEAARALGYSGSRIVLRHLVPNTLAPVIVAATLGIGNTIVLEAGLSFLGLGVQPPTPSWGTMVADGRGNLLGAWWISTFPGLSIALTVLCFNLLGDGLRDAFDPRVRR
jgi:peptide/nickel transport system permease protein